MQQLLSRDGEKLIEPGEKLGRFRTPVPTFLAVILLIACASGSEPVIPSPTGSSPGVELTVAPVDTATPDGPRHGPLVFPYGIVYAYSGDDWSEVDRPAIRGHLEYLRSLGVNTVVQTFSSQLIGTGHEDDWLIFLDEAERVGTQVIARLWPIDDWRGRTSDYRTIQSFLTVVQDHPAMLSYLGLHEPLEQYTSAQLRSFYANVKEMAPRLLIAHYMGNMAWFEKSLRFPGRKFTAGICDICITWYYPARYVGDQPGFEADLVRETLQAQRKLINERAPTAQLWFLGQVYTQYEHKRRLRMPEPEEMEQIYMLAEREQVDGFLWYPWLHGRYDQVLSDPDMEPQRQAVRRIYETWILQGLIQQTPTPG